MSGDPAQVPPNRGRGFAMVGRGAELDLLQSALSKLPAVVFVEGEAGVGKSRLVFEAGLTLAERGLRVLTGLCHQLREPLAFGPVLDALRGVGDELPSPAHLNPQAGALTPFLPELGERLPPVPEPAGDARGARFQLVGAVRAVLDAIGPAVLIIEDVHWADEATRELLLVLGRDMPNTLALVVTYRGEELRADSALLGAPYRRPIGTEGAEIHLGPLTRADVTELAESVLGTRATPEVTRLLFARSDGLPVVVEEDLRTLVDPVRKARREPEGILPASTDDDDDDDDDDDVVVLRGAEVPRGLRETFTARANDLTPQALTLVQASAVLAVPARRAHLAEVAGLNADEARDALVEALRAAVLAELSPARYGFRHVLAQQAVYRAIPGPRREDLHQRALDTLRGQDSPPLVQIAHQTRALGRMDAWLREAEAAADQAIALGDEGTAAMMLHEILDQPHQDAALRTRAALALSHIAVHRLDYNASHSTLLRILADPQLPAPVRGEIRLALANLVDSYILDGTGRRELELAVQELRSRPDLAARAMCALALHDLDHPKAARDHLAQAERTVQSSSDPQAHAIVHSTTLTLLSYYGDPAVWELVDRLPHHAEDPDVLRQSARAMRNAGVAAIGLGLDERAGELLAESLRLARHVRYPGLEPAIDIFRLQLDQLAGRWTGLADRVDALEAEFPDMPVVNAVGSQIRGNLAAAAGHWSRALDQLHHAAFMYGKSPMGALPGILAIAADTARLHLAKNDAAAAFATLAPTLEPLRKASFWPKAGDLLSLTVECALAIGEDTAAREFLAQTEAGMQGANAPAATANLHLARGALSLNDGDTGHAAEQFDQARALFQAIGRPYHVARAIERLASAHVSVRPQLAVKELTDAANAYTRIGAISDAARCDKVQRDLGVAHASPRGRRGYGPQLSPREVQVARLLAVAATNQDIAHALALSPRTVEHHVANVLKKLGVSRDGLREAGLPDSADPI